MSTMEQQTAMLSPCRTWRYALWRDTGRLGGWGTVLFVGLNPSTADETANDQTIRKCIGFAGDWGYARLAMANLYAFRATDPRELAHADDPVGPDTNSVLEQLVDEASCVVAAWGASGPEDVDKRIAAVLPILGRTRYCLGRTGAGYPLHPLYLPTETTLVPYVAESAA